MEKNNELPDLVIKTLENNLPIIKKFVIEKVGPAAKEMIKNDEKMKLIFKTVYNLLPFAVRMVVNENEFVSFCMNNKYMLLDLTEAA